MKDHRLIAYAFILFTAATSQATTWYLPLTGQKTEIEVLNRGRSDVTFWIANEQDMGPKATEIEYSVAGRSHLNISDLSPFAGSSWIQVRSYENLEFHVSLNGSRAMSGRSDTLTVTVPKTQADSQWHITLVNLVPIHQDGVILSSQPGHAPISLQMDSFAKIERSLSLVQGETLIAKFDYPVAALLWNEDAKPTNIMFDVLPSTKQYAFPKDGVDFILSGSGIYSDSFVVHLTDPDHIQQARDQLSRPNEYHPRILSAHVALGDGLQNRNLLSPEKAPWAWHVSEVHGFAGLGSQTCDGSPQFLEDFVLPWVSSNKPICFWNYRVVKELKP